MAILLDDAALEARILEIGRRTGLSPQAVVARAIEQERTDVAEARDDLKRLRQEAGRDPRARLPSTEDIERAERRAAVQQFLARLPPATDDERRAMQCALDDMYDENGLPR